MRPMKATNTLILSTLIATLGAGCASTNNTQRGAVAGAATGAVIGGVVGHQSGEAKAGAAIGAAAGGLAGAVIGHQADRDRVSTADTPYVVQSPPPMPTSQPREAIPARPARDAVWIEGHYVYTGNAQQPYEWVAGHWEIPPPGMTRWVPGGWQRSGNGYIYVRGHWQ